MFRIDAGDFKNTFIDLYDPERTQGHTRSHLYVIHIVNLEVTRLLNPILDERIAQSVFGFAFSQVGAFDNQAILAAFVLSHVRERVWCVGRTGCPRFRAKRRLRF